MATHTPVAPALPPASIDFNALDAACRAGKSPEDALAAALIPDDVLDLGEEAAAPVEEPAPEPEPEPAPEPASPTAADF